MIVLIGALAGCASIGRRAALPGSYLKPPESQLAPSQEYELGQARTAAGETIALQFGAAEGRDGQVLPDWRGRPSIVFCYGNRMSIAGSQGIFRDLRRMGLNVIVPDYPGYAMSPGSPSEQGCYRAAEAAYNYLVSEKGLQSDNIGAVGLSLGTSVATELALRKTLSVLVLVVPFTRTQDIARDHLSWYLQWTLPGLTRDVAFDTLSKASKITVPILLVEASKDEVTSASRTSELARAIKAPLTRIRVDADHNGAWSAAVAEIEAWLVRTLKVTSDARWPSKKT